MAYSTLTDIKEQLDEAVLIQLTDDEDLEAVDAGRVERAIADADAEIDAFIGARYTLPLASTPDIVRKWSVEIAIYNLYARRDDSITDTRQKRYDNIIKSLRLVADGTITLGADDPNVEAGTVGVDYTGRDQVMTPEKLANF